MKANCTLLLVLLLAVACDKNAEEPIPPEQTLLSGRWMETEAFISNGGPQYWVDVEDGETLEFTADGTFTSDRYAECATGTYFLEGTELMLLYDCEGFEPASANENGFITYLLEFYPDYFIISPTSGPICIEGCSYKYRRQ